MAYTLTACCVLAMLAGAAAGAGKANTQDSVVQKVIEMLQENKVKIAGNLKNEEAEMAEYSQFCDDETSETAYGIKTAARKILGLDAVIADAKAQVSSAEDEIAALGTEMAGKDKELAAAATTRAAEKSDFETTEKALVSSVDQLEKAVVLLKRGAAALLQKGTAKPDRKKEALALSKLLDKVITAAWVDQGSAKVLKGFLQDASSAQDQSDELHLSTHKQPEEGGSILATLEDMKEKAQETLSGARMTEMKGEHNYQMMKQSLQDQLNLAKSKLSDATSLKASLTEDIGKADGERSTVQKTKVADSVYLDNLKGECSEAAASWAERAKSAKEEMAAIEKAKAILSERVKVFFVQTNSNDPWDGAEGDDEKTAMARGKLVEELKALGHKLNSYAMMELASSAAGDPFEKIKGLISDMIAKLVSEANEEASQKTFCDEEKAKSSKEQEDKSMRSDELRSRLDSATAAQGELEENIKELQAQVAAGDKAVAEATKLRSEEAATYVKESTDYKSAAAAVEEAIHVLKEYYASTSLVEVQSTRQITGKQPSFGGAKSDAASSIISILENSGAEFTKMYMQVETTEGEAKMAYEKLMDDSKVEKASKLAEIKGAESEVKSLQVAIQNGGEDLKMVTKELDAVMSYLEKLKPQCETKIMSYAEKKAKREAEIEGLKEALEIIDAPAMLVQLRGTKRH